MAKENTVNDLKISGVGGVTREDAKYCTSEGEKEKCNEKGKEKETSVEVEDESEIEDDEYSANSDSDDSGIPVDSDLDEEWEWTTVLPTEIVNEINDKINKFDASVHSNNNFAVDFEGQGQTDSDELDTPPGSDGEEPLTHSFPKFKPPEGSEPIKFQVGLIFNSKKVLREAVKDYGIQNKKNLFFDKNDSKRVVVKCMNGCPFYMRFSQRVGTHYWQLVSISDNHSCFRTARNRLAKTEWLATKFVSILSHSPYIKVKGLIAEAKNR